MEADASGDLQLMEDSAGCHSEERSDEESVVSLGIGEKQIPRSVEPTGAQKARFARDDNWSEIFKGFLMVGLNHAAWPMPT